jgi:SAM-dependent methyltransferase
MVSLNQTHILFRVLNKLTNVFLDIFYQGKILEDIVPRKHIKFGKSTLHPPHSTSYFVLNQITKGNISKEIGFEMYNNFYDIGSGYGRVLLYFNRFFQKQALNYSIYGLELQEDIFLRCKNNTKKNNLEIINANALKFHFKSDSIVFLFNPFDRSTLEAFVGNIKSSNKRICVVFWGHNKFEHFPPSESKLYKLSKLESCLIWKNEIK